MKKNEAELYTLIKSHLPGDFERVENFASVGTPDISGAWGRDYFVELKAQPLLADADMEKLLEKSQRVWLARRCPQGTLTFIIVRFSNRIIISKATADSMVPLASIKKRKNKWDWPHFEATIQKEIKGC